MAKENKVEQTTETKAPGPLAGKPRTVLSWLKAIDNKPESLAMLGDGSTSVEDLKKVIEISEKILAKANDAIERQAEIELEREEKALKAQQEKVEALRRQVAEQKKEKKD